MICIILLCSKDCLIKIQTLLCIGHNTVNLTQKTDEIGILNSEQSTATYLLAMK